MRRPLARLAALMLLSAATLWAQSLPELFQQAKTQVRSESWSDALATLDRLEAEAAKPGNEAASAQLAGPIAFYRGVCEANLGRADNAQADFAAYLRQKPDSTIDTAIYSKRAVAAYEAARKEVALEAAGREGSGPSNASTTLLRRFQEFKSPPNMGEKPDEGWADGPVKWIITADEKAAWVGLTDGAERAEFVEKFWERRNPKPGPEHNIARTGFDRRVAFADAYLGQDEQRRGSLTDRGMVFVLLGPPSWTGRKPVMATEERSISDGAGLEEQWWMGARNSIHIDGQRATNADGFREIWHYLRDALPKGVSASQVNVVFLTKTGYGRSVLQREPATLSALDAARSAKSAR